MTWSTLLRALVDIESVSGNEAGIADQVEAALTAYDHLEVSRDGNVVVARTELGRAERVVVAGHLDTVPIAANVPSWVTNGADGAAGLGPGGLRHEGRGGGAAGRRGRAGPTPNRDVTWIFYDNEEVEEEHNGLRRLAASRPEQLAADFAILCEPSNARIEGGCQGTMRAEVDADRRGGPLGAGLDGAQRDPRRRRGAAAAGRLRARRRSRSTVSPTGRG